MRVTTRGSGPSLKKEQRSYRLDRFDGIKIDQWPNLGLVLWGFWKFLQIEEKSRLNNEIGSEKYVLMVKIGDAFRKVEVNIPLLDAIKQIPRYSKFLKELCTNKRKLKGNEFVSMGENVLATL
ncbi:hypothetical protein PTKIN_Ptkin13bG0032600 [Pterospermum kingtungense]